MTVTSDDIRILSGVVNGLEEAHDNAKQAYELALRASRNGQITKHVLPLIKLVERAQELAETAAGDILEPLNKLYIILGSNGGDPDD